MELIHTIPILLPPPVEAFFKQLTGFRQTQMCAQHQLVPETKYLWATANQAISYTLLNPIQTMGLVLLEQRELLFRLEPLHQQLQLVLRKVGLRYVCLQV
jgi:hypothetical protein